MCENDCNKLHAQLRRIQANSINMIIFMHMEHDHVHAFTHEHEHEHEHAHETRNVDAHRNR